MRRTTHRRGCETSLLREQGGVIVVVVVVGAVLPPLLVTHCRPFASTYRPRATPTATVPSPPPQAPSVLPTVVRPALEVFFFSNIYRSICLFNECLKVVMEEETYLPICRWLRRMPHKWRTERTASMFRPVTVRISTVK